MSQNVLKTNKEAFIIPYLGPLFLILKSSKISKFFAMNKARNINKKVFLYLLTMNLNQQS